MAASLPQLNKVVPHLCLFAEGAEILRGISDGGDDLAATLMSCQRGRERPYGQGGHFSGKDSIGPEDYRHYDQAKRNVARGADTVEQYNRRKQPCESNLTHPTTLRRSLA